MMQLEMIGGNSVFLALAALFLGPCDRSPDDSPAPTRPAVVAAEEVTLEDARQTCLAGDCITGYGRARATIPEGSEYRRSRAYRELEALWAKEVIEGALADADARARVKMLEEVAATPSLDQRTRDMAVDFAKQLAARAAPKAESTSDREWRLAGYEATKVSRLLEARALGMKNPKGTRALLVPRVAAGMAYREEAEFLLAACRKLKDDSCSARVENELPSFPSELEELATLAEVDPASVRTTLNRRIVEHVGTPAEAKLLAELCTREKGEPCSRKKSR